MDALTQVISERFLLELVLKCALLMVAAFAITFALRRASAAIRHAVWSLAFVSLLLLPVLAVVVPAWEVVVPRFQFSEAAFSDGLRSLQVETVQSEEAGDIMKSPLPAITTFETVADLENEANGMRSAPDSEKMPWSWISAALVLWISGALLLFIRMALVLIKLSIVRRNATTVDDPIWTEHMDALTDLLGIHRPIQLLRHEEVVVPMTYGVRRPVILLPDHADGWSDDQKHATLMHELLHVQRLDHLVHILAISARALHWYNPLAWAASKRLVLERERACDDGVLAMGVPSTSYADHLLGMARYVLSGREASAAALAMARPSELRSRIVAILEPGKPRRTLTRLRFVSLSACAFMLILLVAAVQPGAANIEVDETPVSLPTNNEDPAIASAVARGGTDDVDDSPSRASGYGAVEPESPTDRIMVHVLSDDNSAADIAAEAAVPEEAEERAAKDTTDVETQKRAIHAISELPEEQSVPLLTEIAETHPSVELRKEAIFWLGESGASVAELLVSFARNDESVDIQKRAVFALSELEDDLGVPYLLDMAQSHQNVEVRQEAVFWLGQAGGPEVADHLADLAKTDPSPEIQKKALFALSQLDTGDGVPHLIDIARTHSNPTTRSEAIFWLGETEDPRAADVLMEIVNQ